MLALLLITQAVHATNVGIPVGLGGWFTVGNHHWESSDGNHRKQEEPMPMIDATPVTYITTTVSNGVTLLTTIIHGQENHPLELEYPWQVAIVYKGGMWTLCGGSLINSKWVMTAAHCTHGIQNYPDAIEVLLNNSTKTERFAVKQIINHPYYDKTPWTNGSDISLLELHDHVNFTGSKARLINLPTGNRTYLGKEANVTDYQITGYDAPRLPHLQWVIPHFQEVTIDVVNPEKCKSKYRQLWRDDSATQICAGGKNGTDGCSGESGGPLITKEGDNYVQIGVVSFTAKYCSSYGVYTRVTHFMDWINATIRTSLHEDFDHEEYSL